MDNKTKSREMYDHILWLLREEIKKALENHTQEEVADLCDTTQPTIQRILKGTRGQNLLLKTVLNIAVGLNIDIARLITLQPNVTSTEKIKILLAEVSKLVSESSP